MIGYHHFVRVFSRNPNAKLQLLVPEWMLNPDDERMGYEIDLEPVAKVRSQVKHECLYGAWLCLHTECPMKHRFCQDAVFIDDTISTGETAGRLRSFWHSEYGLQVPKERVLVITDLSQASMSSHARKDKINASDEGNRSL
jgi:hypothetical protein